MANLNKTECSVPRKKRGFTLTEAVTAIVIIVLVSAAAHQLLSGLVSAAARTNRIFFSAAAADSAIELFSASPENFISSDGEGNPLSGNAAEFFGAENIEYAPHDETDGYTVSVYYSASWQLCPPGGAAYVLEASTAPNTAPEAGDNAMLFSVKIYELSGGTLGSLIYTAPHDVEYVGYEVQP